MSTLDDAIKELSRRLSAAKTDDDYDAALQAFYNHPEVVWVVDSEQSTRTYCAKSAAKLAAAMSVLQHEMKKGINVNRVYAARTGRFAIPSPTAINTNRLYARRNLAHNTRTAVPSSSKARK